MLPLLSCYCLYLLICSIGSLTFSPTSSICRGYTVNITCYTYPSTVLFQPYAEIILFPTSEIGTNVTFNINSSIPGYSVTGDIPVREHSARLQLTIHSYQTYEMYSLVYCYPIRLSGERYLTPIYNITPRISCKYTLSPT